MNPFAWVEGGGYLNIQIKHYNANEGRNPSLHLTYHLWMFILKIVFQKF